MTIKSINRELNVTLKNNVKILLNYCNSQKKSIMSSKLSIINKKNNIKKIQNYFNINYNNLKNKLNLNIKKAQAPTINKYALLIGCNYIGTKYELNGCINDIENIRNKLKNQYGFNNILIITDKTSKIPTKTNILNEINVLLNNSKSGDKLFLGFSGHGTYTKDTSGDEKNDSDEMFVPLDFNCISDDEIKI